MVEKRWKKGKNSKQQSTIVKSKEIEANLDPVDTSDEEETQTKWYQQFQGDKYVSEKPAEDQLVSLRIEAQHILDEETKSYNLKQSKVKHGSSAAWINTVLKKGTARDKVAANVITIQNSPVHSLTNLTALVMSVNPAKKKECTIVMETLADLFVEDLLRPERKLRTFDNQPLIKLNEFSSGCAKSRRLRLATWLFEDKLKDLYIQFVNAVNVVAKDTIDANRIKAVSVMYRLLSGHPEQEQVLLQNLINKLGDPQQKVVSKVTYCLTQLLRVHPNMKQIIMNEVEKLLFRPNINSRTQYYCICFLSQFVFSSENKEVAKNMISIYFSFFKALIKKGEIDSRLMGALLMGVKRAYPYAKLDSNSIKEHIDTLYKLVHLTPFNIALHALALLQEISDDTNDRFYSALYKKLFDPKLHISCHHALFINLMFKALSKDSNTTRVKAFIKRLLQICLYSSVPLICGILYMISQLISRRKLSLFADNIEVQFDAFTSFASEGDDDCEEKYIDADKEKEVKQDEEVKEEEEEEKDEKKPLRGWIHCKLNRHSSSWSTVYDPFLRNPAYCKADKTAYTELLQLSRHFHPTVTLFSNKILRQEVITYTGDPLVDFTLAKFLERFVFKNPKIRQSEGDKGPDPQLAQRRYYQPSGVRALQVTSSGYLANDVKNIPVDELFLYSFLKKKYENRGPERGTRDDDNESVTSEEFIDMIDKMYGNKTGKRLKNIDFMDEIENDLKKKSKTKAKKKDDEDEDDTEEESSEEEEDENMSDFSEDGDDDIDEVIDFNDDGEDFDGDLDFEDAFSKKSKKNTNYLDQHSQKSKKSKKKSEENLENLFAPAEEFAQILEDAGSAKHKPGMASSLATTDNAAVKQIDWETKRERWAGDANRNKRKWKGKNQKHFKRRKT